MSTHSAILGLSVYGRSEKLQEFDHTDSWLLAMARFQESYNSDPVTAYALAREERARAAGEASLHVANNNNKPTV